MIYYILSILIAPLIAFSLIIFLRKRFGPELYPGLVKVFFWGAASLAIVLLFQQIAHSFQLNVFSNLRRIFFYSFVVMGLGSELGKYLILRYFAFTKNGFDGPAGGIVYSIIISMGFAFMGNIMYFILPWYGEPDFTYALSVIFANICFAIILGFFVGLAKTRENRFVDLMTGLLGASFFHALYSFCFIPGHQDYRLLLFLSIGIFVIVILLLYKAVNLNDEHRRMNH